jgi:cytoskeletal protein CcmA (bactofilin family)
MVPLPQPDSQDADAMFRRKKSDHEGVSVMSDASDGLGAPPKPNAGPGPRALGTIGAARPTPTPMPPSASATTTPLPMPRPLDPPTRRGDGHGPPIIPTPKARDPEMRRLIVGREISLTGEITSCDRLIVEGSVEANLTNCREVEIADSGLLKGSASIEEADIRGRFEGTLTVRKRLFVRATGKIIGTVRYGQLEVECGGQISGDIQAQPTAEEAEPRLQRSVVSMPSEMKL